MNPRSFGSGFGESGVQITKKESRPNISPNSILMALRSGGITAQRRRTVQFVRMFACHKAELQEIMLWCIGFSFGPCLAVKTLFQPILSQNPMGKVLGRSWRLIMHMRCVATSAPLQRCACSLNACENRISPHACGP